jgi:hypothetical protein
MGERIERIGRISTDFLFYFKIFNICIYINGILFGVNNKIR